MKHIYITLIIIFSSFVLNAQEVFFLHAVKVHEDRVESFEKIGDPIYAPPIIHDGSLFILTQNSRIFGLN